MKGINKVILIGNAGKDPEYKTMQDGTAVAKLTLAMTES
jgi:single-strand DNA-binding protein